MLWGNDGRIGRELGHFLVDSKIIQVRRQKRLRDGKARDRMLFEVSAAADRGLIRDWTRFRVEIIRGRKYRPE